MRIRRFSPVSSQFRTREIACTEAEHARYLRGGISIRRAFPYLSDGDRDFIRFGISPDEWDEALDEMWEMFCEVAAKYDDPSRV